jgi:hypothetical protein
VEIVVGRPWCFDAANNFVETSEHPNANIELRRHAHPEKFEVTILLGTALQIRTRGQKTYAADGK